MALLSATVNTRQPDTLPSNTVQNQKNDAHCMAITTRGGKQTIDPMLKQLSMKRELVKQKRALEKMLKSL